MKIQKNGHKIMNDTLKQLKNYTTKDNVLYRTTYVNNDNTFYSFEFTCETGTVWELGFIMQSENVKRSYIQIYVRTVDNITEQVRYIIPMCSDYKCLTPLFRKLEDDLQFIKTIK